MISLFKDTVDVLTMTLVFEAIKGSADNHARIRTVADDEDQKDGLLEQLFFTPEL